MSDKTRIDELEKRVKELESRQPQIIIMPAPVYYPVYGPTHPMLWPNPQITCSTSR